jgi:hypothetical protein
MSSPGTSGTVAAASLASATTTTIHASLAVATVGTADPISRLQIDPRIQHDAVGQSKK